MENIHAITGRVANINHVPNDTVLNQILGQLSTARPRNMFALARQINDLAVGDRAIALNLQSQLKNTLSPLEQGQLAYAMDNTESVSNQKNSTTTGPSLWDNITNIDFDLNQITNEIVVIGTKVKAAICPPSPIQVTAGADAYIGIGASASFGGSVDFSTGQLRFVTDSALGLGVGGGLGVNAQLGQKDSGASFASQVTATYLASATIAAPVEEFGALPHSWRDYSASGGSYGWGPQAGLWGNNSVTYTSPASEKLYDLCKVNK